jgi:hypothetical protein
MRYSGQPNTESVRQREGDGIRSGAGMKDGTAAVGTGGGRVCMV